MLRFDHIGVVVDDLDAVTDFFVALGFERQGGGRVDGEIVDRINGLDGVEAQFAMVRTPDGTGKLELVKYHAPATDQEPRPLPPNRLGFRHIAIEVDDVDATVGELRDKGFEPVGEAADFKGSYRLVYVRGPEGLIVEFAESLAA
jgi:catechol 2,3-dioxygenase-like lactoylglutathione lyase family enzyme